MMRCCGAPRAWRWRSAPRRIGCAPTCAIAGAEPVSAMSAGMSRRISCWKANAQLIARRFPELAFAIVTPDGAAHWDGRRAALRTGRRSIVHDDDCNCGPGKMPPRSSRLAPPFRKPRIWMRRRVHRIGRRWVPSCWHCMRTRGCRRRCTRRRTAAAAICMSPRRRRCSAKGRRAPGSCSLVSSQATRKTSSAARSSGQLGRSWIARWRRPASTGAPIYITNAVKHFKFTPRGKRRIHQTPEAPEIQACRFWLDVELVRLRPKLVVAMGGTAARAVLGRPVTISRERGRPIEGAGRTERVRHRPPVVPAAGAGRRCKGAGIPRVCRGP